MHSELDAILSENAELFETCELLTRDRVTVAKTLEQNLKLFIGRNKEEEQRLRELEEEVIEKESLIVQIQSLVHDLCHCGLDLSTSAHLNAEYYSQLFAGRLPEHIPGCEQLNPIIYHIVSTIPYFKTCYNHGSFVDRCSELIPALTDQNDSVSIPEFDIDYEDYEKKLREEQIAFQREFAHKAVRTKKLIEEHDRIRFAIKGASPAVAVRNRAGVYRNSLRRPKPL
jgi:hypothetical protein